MAIPAFTASQLRASAPQSPTALTIGVLDGVHRGHLALLGQLAAEARARDLEPGVVTLHPHPLTVLRPEIQPSYLTSLERRIELMLEAGISWVTPLTFTSDLAEVEGIELARAFHEILQMRLMVLGPDAAFGRGAPKDTHEQMQRLGREIGFDVIRIEPFLNSGERVSSSAVRAALADGDMPKVTALLGREFTLSGPVIKGFERGRTIGFPTANISVAADRAMPALGVYATHAEVEGRAYAGATNIGRRPTFDEGHISVETHLLDFEGDIYGRRMEIGFVERIRPERKFESVEALSEQIAKDVRAARELVRGRTEGAGR